MIYSLPAAAFEAVVDFGITGLTGVIGARVVDNQGVTVVVRTTAGVLEDPAASAIYEVTLTAPVTAGQYTVVWDDGAGHWAADDLIVTADLPVTIPSTPAGSDFGPCTSWISGDDLIACGAEESSDGVDLDYWAVVASEIMFEMSGRQFSGLCGPTVVRPCRKACACGWQVLSRGHIVWSGDAWSCDEEACGCPGESLVTLWYPVRTIIQVKIDGDVVDPSEYRVVRSRQLMRLDSATEHRLWPTCQNVTLADTEDGTFSIVYTWGAYPPESGKLAATQLAMEMLKECNGEACALPKGTVRMTRQGVTIEKASFASWVREGGWKTGLPLVDAFLSAFNPAGLRRRPVIWSPASHLRYPQPK